MLLFHLAAQKVGQALPRRKVVIHRPVEGLAGRIIDPVLAGPGSEHRVLDIEQKHPARPQRMAHLPVYRIKVCDVMQSQVGDHTVPPVCRVFVVLNAADAVGDPTIGVALLRLSDHPVAEVDPQHLCRALFRRILTVPPIPTPQVQHGFALQKRKQRLQLMPLPRFWTPSHASLP